MAYKSRAIAQAITTMVIFDKVPAGVLSFTKNWAYPWIVVKLDNGKFSKVEEGNITAADTTHLYFTANCQTNVQGGYKLRYCYATKKGAVITLNFADGQPGYASEFDVDILKDKFNFKPIVVYPEFKPDEKIVYTVTGSKLMLYQHDYTDSNFISGYIDAEFVETINNKESHKYYFRGYFKTPLKS